MDTLRFIAALLCATAVIAASCWLSFMASYWAWFWFGLWGAIPVGIVAGSISLGVLAYGVSFLGMLWLGGGGR